MVIWFNAFGPMPFGPITFGPMSLHSIIKIIIINTHFIAPNTRRLLGASQIKI